MKKYWVIGYDDEGVLYIQTVEANSPEQARDIITEDEEVAYMSVEVIFDTAPCLSYIGE